MSAGAVGSLAGPAGVAGRRPVFLVAAVSSAVLILVLGMLLLSRPPAPASDRPAVSQSQLVAATGVRIVRVDVTGGGGLVDLRYQVVDPDKAPVLHEKEGRPYLVDGADGRRIDQPFMGHFGHTGEFKAGLVYSQLFVNSGGTIRPGDRVAVYLGGLGPVYVDVR